MWKGILELLPVVLAVALGSMVGQAIHRFIFGNTKTDIYLHIDINAPTLEPEEWTALGEEMYTAVSQALKDNIQEVQIGKRS